MRLFERTRRKVALTHAGAAFLEEARATLARAAQAVDLVRRAARGEVGRLAVGYLAATAYTLLPLVLRDFRQGFPGREARAARADHPAAARRAAKGDIDVAMLRPPVSEAELASEILAEPFVLALPARHPLRALRRGCPRSGSRASLSCSSRASRGSCSTTWSMGFCLRGGFTPRVAQEAYQTHAVVGLVSAGIGVALVPASTQKIGLAGVAYRPLREAHAAVAHRGGVAPRRRVAGGARRSRCRAPRREASKLPPANNRRSQMNRTG